MLALYKAVSLETKQCLERYTKYGRCKLYVVGKIF